MDALPKIREEVEALPVNEGGSERFLLYDRSGLSDAQLAVSAGVMFVVARLDGRTPLLDLAALYERETGRRIEMARLEEMLRQLDGALFLDNAAFAEFYDRLRREFLAAPVRQAVCAGSAYPADPVELRKFLNEILRSAPPCEEEGRATNASRPAPRGLIAPHMDFQRAAATYGQVYRELAKFTPPEAVVILGTAHQPIRQRYALCDKDFAVPGGAVALHRELARELWERCRNAPVTPDANGEAIPADFKLDLFAHRFEHSVELQAVWLRHLWGDRIRIIPLLAGPLGEFLQEPSAAARDPQIAALREVLQDFSRRGVMLLASADLAHIGPRFGDSRRIDRHFLEETEQADRAYLLSAAEGEATTTLSSLSMHGDCYHLCGTGCIYALKSAIYGQPPRRGRLLGYQQAVTSELEQAVTCAGMMFE